jgi:toxin YhaV
MTGGNPAPLVVNGWTIFAHPLFLSQIDALTRQVEALKPKDRIGYAKRSASERLAAITKLAFEVIPQDPARAEYRQGNTLGDDHKHWFRAKFFQQYRLFFRYHATSKVIVFAWVNDDDTKRAYEKSDDAYRVFRRCWKVAIHRMTGINCWSRRAAKAAIDDSYRSVTSAPNFQLLGAIPCRRYALCINTFASTTKAAASPLSDTIVTQ